MTDTVRILARRRRLMLATACMAAAIGVLGALPDGIAFSQGARTPTVRPGTARPATTRTSTPAPTPTRDASLDRTPEPTGIERQDPPSPVCAVADGVLSCYSLTLRLTANGLPRGWFVTQAKRISPEGKAVLDFTLAPDGSWVAYRYDSTLAISPISGGSDSAAGTATAVVIDTEAAPPAALDSQSASIAWAPDGLGIAYITALGVRTAYPGAGYAADLSRPYINVRWSRDGSRLAAQSAEGAWSFFASGPGKLTLTRIFAQSADAAWLDDRAVVLAPTVGGLLRLDASAAADAPPEWYIADEYFIKLRSGEPGEVLGLHPEGGGAIGSAVSIRADGQWTALGRARLDSRLDWGPEPGGVLYYITSGTPILVDRATGDENLLPMQRVSRVGFNPQVPDRAGFTLDADLYFLAPDDRGVRQLWRLPRSGGSVIQLSRSAGTVSAYQVNGDRVQYTANGVTITVTTDGTIPEAATADASVFEGTLQPTATPRPTATGVPVRLRRAGWQPGPSAIQREGPGGTLSAPFVFENPLPSPSGRYVAGTRGPADSAQLIVLDWETGTMAAVRGVSAPTALLWVHD